MCTVTFLPTEDAFLLTSNRDELYARAPVTFPSFNDDHSLVYPKDCAANGTWIGAHQNGTTACLLNGAFKNHERTPPYRKSRGQVVLDYFSFHSTDAFATHYDLSGIEPFTLIVVRDVLPRSLEQLKWDGTTLSIQLLNSAIPHIWSSVTLYTDEMIRTRHDRFHNWCSRNKWTTDTIRQFHQSTKEEINEQSIFMKRPTVGTVAITTVEGCVSGVTMYYDDLKQLKKHLISRHGVQADQAL